jgi:hypothetical protein
MTDESTSVAGSGTLDSEGVVTPQQVPFSIVVEWREGASAEDLDAAQADIKELMDQLIETYQRTPDEVLPIAIERLTIKRS